MRCCKGQFKAQEPDWAFDAVGGGLLPRAIPQSRECVRGFRLPIRALFGALCHRYVSKAARAVAAVLLWAEI